MAERILIKGGHVLTVDPELGDIAGGDVLIEDGRIAQVGTDLNADAEVVDAEDDIVIPGFVDTHRHVWEAAIRNCAPNATLDDYFVEVLDSFAPLYRPEDVYASNLAGALECINAGITTVLDWSHINNTPDHPDAAIRGLTESGVRAVYAYGSANTSLADYWFNSSIVIPREDVERIRKTYFSSTEGLLTMALATRGPGFSQDGVVREEWGMARDLEIPITTHFAMGKLAGKWSMVKQLRGLGLLGPDTTYIHACYLSDEEWQLVADSRGTISISPQVEMQMGHGWPPVMKARSYGLRPSLSVDVVTTVPGDMFSEMRCAFAAERWRSNDSVWESEDPLPDDALTARDMLTMATLDGAHVTGLEDRTGSLTPGKEADVVILDGSSVGITPIIDPVAAVVLCADTSNVDTVIVGGKIQKRNGRLVGDWEAARKRLRASTDYLVDALEKRRAAAAAEGS
ncbi:MAG TPA: amidohydrolase family protein [Actinomycetota bacterium]